MTDRLLTLTACLALALGQPLSAGEVTELDVCITETKREEGKDSSRREVTTTQAVYLDRVDKQTGGRPSQRTHFVIAAKTVREVTKTVADVVEPPVKEAEQSALVGRQIRWTIGIADSVSVAVLGQPKVGNSWDINAGVFLIRPEAFRGVEPQKLQERTGATYRAKELAGLPDAARYQLSSEVAAQRMLHGKQAIERVAWSVEVGSEPEAPTIVRLELVVRVSGTRTTQLTEYRVAARKPSRGFPPEPSE